MKSVLESKTHFSSFLIPIVLLSTLILVGVNDAYEDPYKITGYKERVCTNEKILTSLLSETEEDLDFFKSCKYHIACDDLAMDLKKIALVDPNAYMILGDMFVGKAFSQPASKHVNCELHPDPALATLYYREAQKNNLPSSGSRLREVCSRLEGLNKLKTNRYCDVDK